MTDQHPSTTASAKFSSFTILKTSYKTVDTHAIEVYVLVPKSLATAATTSDPLPVVVKFHGGYLVTGDAIFPDWFPDWLVQYTLQHNAVVVMPNHRLIPEATGLDIAEDMADFWTWVRDGSLQEFLNQQQAGTPIDLGKVLATGESAGGYLSIHSALGSTNGLPRASIAMYPVLDINSRFFTEEYDKAIFGAPPLPKDILAAHLKEIGDEATKNGKPMVVTSATPPERLPIALSIVQQGVYKKLLGEDSILDPFSRVETVRADDVPPILIVHGKEDSAVPIEGSERWLKKAKATLGEDKVVLVVQPGEHGFDADASITIETPWLKDSLARVTKAWLA